MPFKVTARTILQLGGELISSDGIAFYELIKNAFDAGSEKVLVNVVSRLPVETIESALVDLKNIDPDEDDEDAILKVMETTKHRIREDAEPTAKGLKAWLDDIDATDDADDLMAMVKAANSITFIDYGHGMSLKDLNDIYLTIGTPHRKLQRAKSDRVILGEKGIGRLSTMRLGLCLRVDTATAEDTRWNVLEIDWEAFGETVGQLVENIEVDPEKGERIKASEERGTTIAISHLNENWTLHKLTHIANNDIARLLDPFTSRRRISIALKFNGQRVTIPRMNEILTDKAHATLDAEFVVTEDQNQAHVLLTGQVQYLVSSAKGTPLRGRTHAFHYTYDDLCGLFHGDKEVEIDIDTFVSLGPFRIKCYWFNGRLIKKITVNEEVLDLKAIIRQWSGGLALYRDGFRVPPYGSPDDDWLDIDRGAFASQGYKVNRAQLVGKVDITSNANPMLVDQTNREGLRDCREKRVLVGLCRKVLEDELRAYLKEVDDELREQGNKRIDFGDLSDQLSAVEVRINDSLEALAKMHEKNPKTGLQRVERRLRSAFDTVVGVVDEMRSTVEATEDEKGKLLHLAALGLAVEKLAHELNRTTRHALDSLHAIQHGENSESLREAAEIQLISLQKRLQNLDPQLGPKRNRKEEFDLRECLTLAVEAYAGKAKRHDVDLVLEFTPNRPIMLKTVKACLLQVVHNLLDNSFYWLTAKRRRHDVVEDGRQIVITVNAGSNTFEVYDNGPGIAPENKERVFREFYTLKKSGEGKGLGLFISRELMELYGGSIDLSEEHVNDNGRLTTFVVDYSGMKA